MKLDTAVTVGSWGLKTWRYVTAQAWWRKWRDRRVSKLMSALHLDFAHSTRRLASLLHQSHGRHLVRASDLAIDICGCAQQIMCELTGSAANEMHCCMKLIVDANAASPKIATWARSEPHDGRKPEIGDKNAHKVLKNSVWCALLGKADRYTKWRDDFTCFSCNDLPALGTRFCCDRVNWSNYYKSVLVFPMRFAETTDFTDLTTVGFLAFDSPKIGAFPDAPSIYDHVDEPARYQKLLYGTPAFHLGAIFADTLGAIVGPAF